MLRNIIANSDNERTRAQRTPETNVILWISGGRATVTRCKIFHRRAFETLRRHYSEGFSDDNSI